MTTMKLFDTTINQYQYTHNERNQTDKRKPRNRTLTIQEIFISGTRNLIFYALNGQKFNLSTLSLDAFETCTLSDLTTAALDLYRDSHPEITKDQKPSSVSLEFKNNVFSILWRHRSQEPDPDYPELTVPVQTVVGQIGFEDDDDLSPHFDDLAEYIMKAVMAYYGAAKSFRNLSAIQSNPMYDFCLAFYYIMYSRKQLHRVPLWLIRSIALRKTTPLEVVISSSANDTTPKSVIDYYRSYDNRLTTNDFNGRRRTTMTFIGLLGKKFRANTVITSFDKNVHPNAELTIDTDLPELDTSEFYSDQA